MGYRLLPLFDIYMDKYHIYFSDCFDIFPSIPDHSVDMILCDLPFQMTHNAWDRQLPMEKLWPEYLRIAKENAAIVLFANGIFTSKLVMSQEKLWRYNLVWDKVLTSGFLNANRQPLRQHEDICVFYRKQPTYNPQKTVGAINHSKGKSGTTSTNNYNSYGFQDNHEALGNKKHPTSILRFPKKHPSTMLHPTEKSIPLCEYLIRTYTNPGEVVMDNCMGVGTTGIACMNTERNFIGIENNLKYYQIASERLNEIANEKSKL